MKTDPGYITGNLVLWDKELWIVAEWNWPHCTLISCNSSNVEAGPSNTWPYKKVFVKCYDGYHKNKEGGLTWGCGDNCLECDQALLKEVYDPKRGIGSVKFVAETLLDYVKKSSKKQFVGLEMDRDW